jgi:beta-mannanase
MNGDWFPWDEGVNGNTPGQFVQAWRHVHDIASAVGATNVTWVWCPNVTPINNLGEFYPGDAYVDWTCLDGYNWGTDPNGHLIGWQTFDQIYHSAYQAVLAIAPSKPLMRRGCVHGIRRFEGGLDHGHARHPTASELPPGQGIPVVR